MSIRARPPFSDKPIAPVMGPAQNDREGRPSEDRFFGPGLWGMKVWRAKLDNKLIAKQRSNPLSGGPLEIHNLVVEAILEGRFTDALGVIFSVPRDQRGYDMSLCLAMSLSGIGLHDSARAELDELKFLADSDPQWGLVRALTFFREGRFKEAFDCLISARHAERHPLCEPSFFSSYDFEELLDRCRAKLHDEWYARSGEPPEFWDLRLEKMELPFGYIEEMDVSPPAEIRAMYYGIPGVLP